jgi:hypothetical protein
MSGGARADTEVPHIALRIPGRDCRTDGRTAYIPSDISWSMERARLTHSVGLVNQRRGAAADGDVCGEGPYDQ